MAKGFRKFVKGVKLIPNTTSIIDSDGELAINGDKLEVHLDGAAQTVVTAGPGGEVTGLTIDGDDNTLLDISLTSFKTELADANTFVTRDGTGAVVSTLDVPTGDVVGTTATQVITNKDIQKATLSIKDASTHGLSIVDAETLTADRTLSLSTADANRSISLAGNLTVSANANVAGTNSGDLTLTAAGSTPNANGASISGQALTLQPASATQPGILSAVMQDIGGTKIFNGGSWFKGGIRMDESFYTPSGTTNVSVDVSGPITTVQGAATSVLSLVSVSGNESFIILHNGTGHPLTLKHDATVGVGRIHTSDGFDVTLPIDAAAILYFDPLQQWWHTLGGSGSGSGAFVDSNSVDFSAVGPNTTADVKLSASAAAGGNTLVNLSIQSDGLRAQIPNSSITGAISATDTNSVDLTYVSGALSADVKLSAAAAAGGNTLVNLSIQSDGIRAQLPISAITGAISVSDTNTIDMSYVSGVVSGDVKLSAAAAAAGNTLVNLSSQTDGVRAQIPLTSIQSAISVTDTNSVDLTYTSGAVSADVKLSAAAASAANLKATTTIKSDGLHVEAPFATSALAGFISTAAQDIPGTKTFKAPAIAEGGLSLPSTNVSTAVMTDIAYAPHIAYTGSVNGTLNSIAPPATGSNGAICIFENRTLFAVAVVDSFFSPGANGNRFILQTSDASGIVWLLPNESITLSYGTADWKQISVSKQVPQTAATAIVGNYLSSGHAETTARMTLYRDGTSALPVDAQGGTIPSGFAITTTTNTRIYSKATYQWTKPFNVDCQGTGIRLDDIQINNGDIGRILEFSFDYRFSAGQAPGFLFNAGIYSDAILYFVYFNGSAYVPLAPIGNIKIDGSVTSGANYTASCQIQVPADCVALRPVIHVATATLGAWTMNIDNVFVGRPKSAASGFAGSDWVSYTPTFNGGSAPTNSVITGKYRRVGDTMELSGALTFSGAPSAFSTMLIGIPSGLSIDTGKISSPVGNAAALGTVNFLDTGAALFTGVITNSTNTSLDIWRLGTVSGANPVNVSNNYPTNTTPFAFGNLDVVTWNATFPIAGWSSNVTQSSESDGRVVGLTARRVTSNQSIANASQTTIILNGTATDTHAAYNPATGIYTVPVTGWYTLSAGITFTATSATGEFTIQSFMNGQPREWRMPKTGAAVQNPQTGGTRTEYCLAGSTIYMQVIQSTGGSLDILSDAVATGGSWMSIVRNPQSAVVQATETVSFKAGRTGVQSVPNITQTTVLFNTVQWDTHNAYNSGTGIYTVPVSGLYEVKLAVLFGANSTGIRETYVLAGGVTETIQFIGSGVLSSVNTTHAQGATQVRLLAGQTIAGRCFQSTGGNLDVADIAGAQYTRMSIIRVGNY